MGGATISVMLMGPPREKGMAIPGTYHRDAINYLNYKLNTKLEDKGLKMWRVFMVLQSLGRMRKELTYGGRR